MRIGIVNDLALAVEVLKRVVLSVPGYEIAWIAKDGAEAVQMAMNDVPDLILMDLIMPVMDGVESTRRIMQFCACPILVVTFSVGRNATMVFQAMGYGALDAVNTPVMQGGPMETGQELLDKIAVIAKLASKPSAGVSYIPKGTRSSVKSALPPLLLMGASTGGPAAYVQVVSKLPKDLPFAVVILQHIDHAFAPGFAEWLSGQTPLSVQLAKAGTLMTAGSIYVADTINNLCMDNDFRLDYTDERIDSGYHPVIDILFESVAKVWPERYAANCMAVLMTGMGRDGAIGLKALRQKGWHTVAQDKKSSVVYGMPKAAAELDAASAVVPLDGIADAILSFVMNRLNSDIGTTHGHA